jgi:hypothetical protein
VTPDGASPTYQRSRQEGGVHRDQAPERNVVRSLGQQFETGGDQFSLDRDLAWAACGSSATEHC